MPFATALTAFGQTVHRHLLPLVVAAYALAAACPAPGLWVKRCVLVPAGGGGLTLPTALLAVLLFSAGVGASAGQLGAVARRPLAVLAGVAVNVLAPLAFLLLLRVALLGWHDGEEAQHLLLGLSVVAAMPVAGSSAAWSQAADGNPVLSLGLVVASTLLSPLTTPLVFAVTGGEGAGGEGSGGFLLAAVVVPTAGGLLARRLIGDRVAGQLKPALKAVTGAVLLVLCYSNASIALPQVVAAPDWDYLALVGAAACGLCGAAFASGWLLAKGLRASGPDGRSLVFGLGMSNNGTGLVLAASALGGLPAAVVPVLAYNLVQHLAAGGVARLLAAREQLHSRVELPAAELAVSR